MELNLQTLLQQAQAAKARGFDVVSLDTDIAEALVARLVKAEAELTGFKQIVSAEVLRCQPGDVVLVNMNAKWVGGSAEYEYYRRGLMSILPDGVKAITKVAGVDFSVLTDEQLAYAGLARIPEGWQLVPVEPTIPMLAAFVEVGGKAIIGYRAMLAVAPKTEPAQQSIPFRIGQPVKKVTGEYKISGVVRSVFTKGDGAVRLVVEHTVKDEHGEGSFLHIYGPSNLESLQEGGAA